MAIIPGRMTSTGKIILGKAAIKGVRRAADILGLVPLLERFPRQLSGGQRQRVAMGRAIVRDPQVFLFDEPLSNLDAKLRVQMRTEIKELHQRLKTTTVYVTHDQEEAMTLADRIAVMDHGRIVQVGTPAEIYEQPNSRYVADFIGNINLIEARVVTNAGGQIRMDATGTGAVVDAHQQMSAATGDTVWFAIRPEKISVTHDPPAHAGVNALQGEVWDIGYLGDMTVFYVKLDSGKVVKASMLNAQREVEDPIAYDEKVWVSFGETAGVVLKD